MLSDLRTLIIAAGAIAAFSAGWFVNGAIWSAKLDRELQAQEARLIAQCQANIKITEEISNDYQKKLRASNSRLAELKRMHEGRAVPVAGKAHGPDAVAAGTVDPRSNGLNAATLLDLGAECEAYRLQVIGLQGFINRVWETR
jgi:hypothetical protein